MWAKRTRHPICSASCSFLLSTSTERWHSVLPFLRLHPQPSGPLMISSTCYRPPALQLHFLPHSLYYSQMLLYPVFYGFYPTALALLLSWMRTFEYPFPTPKHSPWVLFAAWSSSLFHSASSCAHRAALWALLEEILWLFWRDLFLL